MIYGAFATSTQGLLAQSRSMQTIGTNVANVNTGGYKRMRTDFQTLVSREIDGHNDMGGPRAKSQTFVDNQGLLQASKSEYDLAISGKGMFVLNTQYGGGGDTLYGRDGSFRMGKGEQISVTEGSNTFTTNAGYLVDKNGYFVQGYTVADDGTVGSSLGSLRIDPFAFTGSGAATTAASLGANVPADKAVNGTERFTLRAYDSSGTLQSVVMTWTKGANPNEWTIDADMTGSGNVTTPAAPLSVTFGADGKISSPTSFSVATDTGLSFSVDLSDVTQFSASGNGQLNYYDYDGRSTAKLKSFRFNAEGFLVGTFDDATTRNLYKLPLATFVNPNGLDPHSGNTWKVSVDSGAATLREADGYGAAVFVPNTRETSNVDLQDEFSRMIITQRAYTSSAKVFTTLDEMTEVARDLKR